MELRTARAEDVDAIVGLLVNDSLGQTREAATVIPDSYHRAFAEIDKDPNNLLVVADHDGEVVGCFQLTFIPYLTYQGSWRAMIEGVRVREDMRSQGLGADMMNWAVDQAKERGCAIVQLTTDKRRPAAHRFYERLGFISSHEGMKLHLG